MLKGRGIDGREAQGTFCHDRNILFLDWGGSCMSLCHLTILLRTVHFILCIIYLNFLKRVLVGTESV